MNQFVHVYIWEKPMGIVSWNAETRQGLFEFLPTFTETSLDISPILFPIEKRRQKSEVLLFGSTENSAFEIPPFFLDCFPGKYAKDLLRYALHNSTKTPESLSPLAYLSLLGNRGMGAFRFEPSGYPELNQSEPIDINQLVRYTNTLYNAQAAVLSERRIRELLRSGLFTKGSSPKALVAINDFTGDVISGQSAFPEGFEGWILKMDGIKERNSDVLRIEYEYYKKALDCGISMTPCRLLKDGHHTHLLCKRIDRNKKEKLHIQSFAALRDLKEDTWEAAFRCMRQLRLSYPDIEQLYKRLIFNVLIGNCNNSAEKILFICNSLGEWHLAPGFNLKPSPNLKIHTLTIGGKGIDIQMEDLLEFGKKLNIKKAKALVKMISEILKK